MENKTVKRYELLLPSVLHENYRAMKTIKEKANEICNFCNCKKCPLTNEECNKELTSYVAHKLVCWAENDAFGEARFSKWIDTYHKEWKEHKEELYNEVDKFDWEGKTATDLYDFCKDQIALIQNSPKIKLGPGVIKDLEEEDVLFDLEKQVANKQCEIFAKAANALNDFNFQNYEWKSTIQQPKIIGAKEYFKNQATLELYYKGKPIQEVLDSIKLETKQ